MAAHSYLRLGRRFFFEVREGYATSFAAIFRDGERRDTPGRTEDDDVRIEFVVTVGAMRDRLDVLGFTSARARAEVERYVASAEDAQVGELDAWIVRMVEVMDDDEWRDIGDVPFMFIDSRWPLRLLLDAAPGDAEFALDITEPVAWGLVDAPPDLCAVAYNELHADAAALGTLVVLTEGSSDADSCRARWRCCDPTSPRTCGSSTTTATARKAASPPSCGQ